jgi:hypothetical protein
MAKFRPLLLLTSAGCSRPVFLVILAATLAKAQTLTTPDLFAAGGIDQAAPTYVPWAGVDDSNILHGTLGQQIKVDDGGLIGPGRFAPSLAVADMNGDGKPDILMADSRGFFWCFMNSGTPTVPAFTHGEVMPVWLGEERVDRSSEGFDNIVPRFQMLDTSGSGRQDIIAGTYAGKLFRVPNLGSGTAPNFRPTEDRDSLVINTRRHGVLWCNYLAPFLTKAFGSGNTLDLLIGDGGYSANSIYLLRNTGSSGSFTFDEDHTQKIIPGFGLEQLAPQVVDWNNDGKPDIITGDRTGDVMVYLNTSTDPSQPTFAPGAPVSFGGVQKFGTSCTVTVCDLTGNHLPNLLIGREDGTIYYALNIGKPGSPLFGPASPVKGVLPPGYRYTAPNRWRKWGAFGMPYEMVGFVNPQIEPGFAFPEGVKDHYAIKFWLWPFKSTYFPERYKVLNETRLLSEHSVACDYHVQLKFNQSYRLHFWLKGDGMTDMRWFLQADYHPTETKFQAPSFERGLDAGGTWSEITESVRTNSCPDPTITTWGYHFSYQFTGQGTFYSTIPSLQEVH